MGQSPSNLCIVLLKTLLLQPFISFTPLNQSTLKHSRSEAKLPTQTLYFFGALTRSFFLASTIYW